MSCYEWENGTIRIPSKEWASLKKKVREAWNDLQERAHSTALEIWNDVKTGTPYERALRKRNRPLYSRALYTSDPKKPLPHEVEWKIRDSIFRGKRGNKVYKPRKKDFPKKTNRDTLFIRGDWAIRFNNEAKNVIWDVSENNRARDHARRDPVVQAFFKALSLVEWTRGSGGKIVGNDEYNRESTYEGGGGGGGGGGNYVCSRYGPKGETSGRW